MFKRSRACYNFVCDDPKGCWAGFKLLGGIVIYITVGAMFYGILGLWENITGKKGM
jgi:hypothetical protein